MFKHILKNWFLVFCALFISYVFSVQNKLCEPYTQVSRAEYILCLIISAENIPETTHVS